MYLVLGQLALLVVPLLSSPQPSFSGPMLDGMFHFCQETVGTETDQLYCTYCTYRRWTVRFDVL
jgi:hypothetical protein